MKVRKRDGRLERFDPSKISGAIIRASRTEGCEEELLAEELASVVSLFLEREFAQGIVPIQDIQEMVEKVLMETGHTEIARSFILYHERRDQLKSNIRVRESGSGAPNPGGPEVDGGVTPSLTPWSKSRIISALMTEAELPVELATEIAGQVENRVFQSGLTRISTSLVRELVDNELFNRDLSGQLLSQSIVGVPGYDLRKLVESDGQGKTPTELQGTVAGTVLRQYALRWIHSPEEGEAHFRGDVLIEGLDHPSGFLALDLEPTLLPAPFGGEGVQPADLAACVRFLQRFVADTVRVEVTDTLLLSHVMRGRAYEEYGEALLRALAAGPVSIQPMIRSPQIRLSRGLHATRTRLLSAAGIRGRAAARLMDAVVHAFLDAAIRVGRELALPPIHVNLHGSGLPEEYLLSKAVLLEAGERLTFGLVPTPSPPLAAVNPLVGGVALALKTAYGERMSRNEEGLLQETGSHLTMAVAALVSKARYMKKLHGRGRGPKAAIRRFLGGNGVAVGPGRYRIVPSFLRRIPHHPKGGPLLAGMGGLDQPDPRLARALVEQVQEEGKKYGQLITLEAPWIHVAEGRSARPRNMEDALQSALAWNRYVKLDPLPEWYRDDAGDRMAFIRMMLQELSEKGHVP